MCADAIDTAVMRAQSLDKNDVLGPTGSTSTICTASCVTSGTSSKELFVTKRVLRGTRRSSLKVKVKRGRYPIRSSDPLLPRGKEHAAEIKLHGTDKEKQKEKAWRRAGQGGRMCPS